MNCNRYKAHLIRINVSVTDEARITVMQESNDHCEMERLAVSVVQPLNAVLDMDLHDQIVRALKQQLKVSDLVFLGIVS